MVEAEMIDTSAATAASAANAPQEIDPQLKKQQTQLLEFNEYLHKCRDLFKSDPAMVRSKVKFRNASNIIVLKVTNER
eukprot:CAMPEP_0185611466 /NCGR_PEP_ID=MMETSP0436-20130131/14720_1 /TAXON_ID=626734 ORGANISM="Favella taraikaensis, Strain Fe Narragansett Bay" /NCGR_SAMPLE_ID=MMETSP0436 /ASSEMBLY_ACC=CAM_ASM_000390 /LENGTH=77 /DNA_ID=CAMNT_0028244317 /DNA_START=11 /DNA_END=244 /DNA_ORIENTATION=+